VTPHHQTNMPGDILGRAIQTTTWILVGGIGGITNVWDFIQMIRVSMELLPLNSSNDQD
jgi:hypothetical protein